MSSPRTHRLSSVGQYEFVKTLGRGVFGKVKLAIHATSKKKVAIKIIVKEKLDANTLKMVRREVMIMKLLDHPNIIKLYEVLEGPDHVFIVMEYAPGGEVIDFIIAHGKLHEKLARQFFRQVVSAIDYCHSMHVIHRDLKPENLLLDENFRIKMIDFGLSNVYNPGEFLKTFCGSPTYSAPELVEQQAYNGLAIDIWSLGVVLFVLVCGYLPFDGNSFTELFTRIIHGDYHIPSFVSDDCRDLIEKMIVVDPVKRATIDEIRLHPWLVLNGGPVAKAVIPSYITDKSKNSLDVGILDELERMGYRRDAVETSVLNSAFNDEAATYYLLCAWRERRKAQKALAAGDNNGETPAGTTTKRKRPLKNPSSKFAKARHRKVKTWDEGEKKTISASSRPVAKDTSPLKPIEPLRPKPRPKIDNPPPLQPIAKPPIVSPLPLKKMASASASATVSGSKSRKNRPTKKNRPSRPRPGKSTITRPQSRHTLHVPKRRAKYDDVDLVLPLPPPSPRVSPRTSASGDDDIKRSMSELISSFQSTFEISTIPEVSSVGSPIDGTEAPREARFPLTHDTTTDLSPELVLSNLRQLLVDKGVLFTITNPFCLECKNDKVAFELEICSIENLSVHGIRFHRLSGDVWEYGNICKEILTAFNVANDPTSPQDSETEDDSQTNTEGKESEEEQKEEGQEMDMQKKEKEKEKVKEKEKEKEKDKEKERVPKDRGSRKRGKVRKEKSSKVSKRSSSTTSSVPSSSSSPTLSS